MRTARRLSAFVRTNALLANLCDRKKSLLTSATEKRACDNGTRIPIAADINSYAKNISIPAAKATVRSCVFFYHLLPNIKKKPAVQISSSALKVGAVFK